MSYPVGTVESHKMANGQWHIEVRAAEGYPTMCGVLSGTNPFPLGTDTAHYLVTLTLREHCDHEGPYRGPRSTGWEDDR